MKLMKFVILLLIAISAVTLTRGDEKAIPPAKSFELVLDLIPQADMLNFADGKCHPKIAIRNMDFQKIPAEQSFLVLMEGTLHLSRPDGTETAKSLGAWFGRKPSDIARGELAIHADTTAVEVKFTIDKPGRYLLWWTSGEKRSNSLVLDKDDEGLHRKP
jgi:hypothetical protein